MTVSFLRRCVLALAVVCLPAPAAAQPRPQAGSLRVVVKDPSGAVKSWTIESSGPSQMSRRGLKKTDFKDGMTLTVKGYQGKKDPVLANGRTLVLADGRSFYIGSVGGPNDGADK